MVKLVLILVFVVLIIGAMAFPVQQDEGSNETSVRVIRAADPDPKHHKHHHHHHGHHRGHRKRGGHKHKRGHHHRHNQHPQGAQGFFNPQFGAAPAWGPALGFGGGAWIGK